MSRLPRRSFLKKVGLGLIAFGPAARALATNKNSQNHPQGGILQPQGVIQQDLSNYFVAGMITGVNGQNLSIEDEQGSVTFIKVANTTNLWKGRDSVSPALVKPGDFFYARGVLNETTLIGSHIWVNIVNFSGSVSRARTGNVSIRTRNGELEVDLPPDAEILVGGKLKPGIDNIAIETQVHIVGLWDEKSRRTRATRVFLPELSLGTEQQVQKEATTSSNTWHGVSSWFCCGPAYGPCGTAGGGSCGNCRSSSYHCAWPWLIRPGLPTCNVTACNYPMQSVTCDQLITVRGVCTPVAVLVNVRDCGPNMPQFCGERAADCKPYGNYDRIVDLTPAAFSAIAPLSQGLFSADVTI